MVGGRGDLTADGKKLCFFAVDGLNFWPFDGNGFRHDG